MAGHRSKTPIQDLELGCPIKVEKISERFLEPLLDDLITQFPFKIINFHSDNGSY